MGDRRGESGNSGEEGAQPRVVLPSKARSFTYCPRRYFFEVHLGREPSLWEKIRMRLGTTYHLLLGSIDRLLKGRRVEEPVKASIGGYLIVGRPDAYEVNDGTLRVVERKSGSAPRRGVWLSDMIQSVLYVVALLRSGVQAERSVVELSYARGGSRIFEVNEDQVSIALRVMQDLWLVEEGIVPAALPSPRKCSTCPFKAECEAIDAELEPPSDGDLHEPGAWLAELGSVYTGFKPLKED